MFRKCIEKLRELLILQILVTDIALLRLHLFTSTLSPNVTRQKWLY